MTCLTRKQAAERLAVSLRTLDGLIARGQLPAYKVGAKLVRIREDELTAYMEARLVAPEAVKLSDGVKQRPCRYVPGMRVV